MDKQYDTYHNLNMQDDTTYLQINTTLSIYFPNQLN